MVDQDLRDETGADGKLLPATIQYIKEGDKDSLSEEVSSRQVPQKLVYATVEYTNTGSTELTDVLFFGSLVQIRGSGRADADRVRRDAFRQRGMGPASTTDYPLSGKCSTMMSMREQITKTISPLSNPARPRRYTWHGSRQKKRSRSCIFALTPAAAVVMNSAILP